jgi:putative transposase
MNPWLNMANLRYQGSQFTSVDFTGRLEAEDIAILMDGKGLCLDNVFIERWFRSLKYEGIYLKHYERVLALKAVVKRYVTFYNQRRYDQTLNNLTPDQVYFADYSDKGLKLHDWLSGQRGALYKRPISFRTAGWVRLAPQRSRTQRVWG